MFVLHRQVWKIHAEIEVFCAGKKYLECTLFVNTGRHKLQPFIFQDIWLFYTNY